MQWCDIVFTRYLVYLCTDIDSYGHTELYNYEAQTPIFFILYELRSKDFGPARWLGAWPVVRCLAGPRSVVRLPGRALVAVAGPRLAAAGLAARVWGLG